MLYQIKEFLAKWRDSSEVGSVVFDGIRHEALKILSLIPDEPYAKWFYHLYTGKKLNLHNPTSFNEKLWWLKLNNRDPLLTICSDKNRVRKYVEKCGYKDILIPQLNVFRNSNDIDFNKYREPVMLKCNSGSGGNYMYDPAMTHFNEKLVRKQLNKALHEKYYQISREWNYKNIPPRIVVEKVIRDKNGNLPSDYRFFCFDGKPEILMIDIGVVTEDGHHRFEYPRNIYDMDFQLLPVRFGRDNYDGTIEKPENFERMKEIARKLSRPFPMCRVDLYNLDGKIYFGEITFYHGGCCQSITPKEWDKKLGDMINLNSDKIILKGKDIDKAVKNKYRKSVKV